MPKMKKRTALFAKLREVFRQHVSQPVGEVIEEINPILRGWMNYFRIGHSSRCFSKIRDWVEMKIRRHLMRSRLRKGKGWNTSPTQSGERVSQGLAGVRKAAGNNKEMKFTALLHHLTVELLRESFYSLKRKAAPGVDGVTWQEYENGLEDRLTDLHGRVHRGAYRATPARTG